MRYCAPMSAMVIMQAGAGNEVSVLDIIIRAPNEKNDPSFLRDISVFTSAHIKNVVAHLVRDNLLTQSPARGTSASRLIGSSNRNALDGWSPFLVKRLELEFIYASKVCRWDFQSP